MSYDILSTAGNNGIRVWYIRFQNEKIDVFKYYSLEIKD